MRVIKLMNDRELVREIVDKGRSNCFADIVHRYSGLVYSKALSLTHREEMAAEITQQTFVKAYEQLAVWRGQEMGGWLSIIATHTALHALDKEKRHRGQPAEELRNLADEEFDEEREEQIRNMERAISRLPEQEQELINRHYYKQEKTADIALNMGLSQQNVLVKLHRIREKLKQALRLDASRT